MITHRLIRRPNPAGDGYVFLVYQLRVNEFGDALEPVQLPFVLFADETAGTSESLRGFLDVIGECLEHEILVDDHGDGKIVAKCI